MDSFATDYYGFHRCATQYIQDEVTALWSSIEHARFDDNMEYAMYQANNQIETLEYIEQCTDLNKLLDAVKFFNNKSFALWEQYYRVEMYLTDDGDYHWEKPDDETVHYETVLLTRNEQREVGAI